MKNLKRALSLVLTSAMLLGMMVVGTGAAFTDVKAEHNTEAIAVVSEAGIMGANEEFNPDGNITRNEMAVVMVNLLGLDVKKFSGASNFAEPAWAMPYVDAVYANSIMTGTGAGFNGSANITTVEASLMMMKALGYFQNAADFGSAWDLAVITKAAEIDLLEGVNAKSNEVMTRNQVAQLVLNTLEAYIPTVTKTAATQNTTITAGDVKVEITNGGYTYEIKENADGEIIADKFYEVNFEDLDKNENATNELGLLGDEWTNDGDRFFFGAYDVDNTVVVTESKKVEKLIKNYKGAEFVGMDETVEPGQVVYFYMDGKDVEDFVVVTYELAQVGEINDELRRVEIEDGYKFEVEVAGKWFYDTQFAGFDYEEDDMILVAYGYNTDDELVIADSMLAEIVEGKVTAIRGEDEVKIAGKYYEVLADAEGIEYLEKNAEVEVTLNKAGQIIAVAEVKDAETKSDDFIYIYSYKVEESEDEINEDGILVEGGEQTLTVWGVLADGSKVKYVVDEKSADKIDTESIDAGEMVVVPYSLKKGELVVESSKQKVEYIAAAELSKKNDEENGLYANSKTEFVFVAVDEDNKLVITTATGVKNVNIDGEDIAVVYNKDDDMLTVFVAAEAEELEAEKSDVQYAILMDEAASEVYFDEDDNEFFVYDVIINGKESTLTTKNEELVAVAGAPFAYELAGKYVDADSVEALAYTNEDGEVVGVYNVDRIAEEYVVIDGDRYEVADAEDFTLTYVFEDDADEASVDFADVEELTMSTSANLKKDAKVIFVANDDDEIEVLFILKASR